RGSAPLIRAPEDLRAELRGRLTGDAEHDLTELRRFRLEELLRIGVHDVAGALDADLVPRQLSDVAEACVDACLDLATAEVQRRDGAPRHPDGSPAGLVVTGLGTLGGRW